MTEITQTSKSHTSLQQSWR